jgi:CelD/BcsL family acetyltransferase involved in cellulose biosynthesis
LEFLRRQCAINDKDQIEFPAQEPFPNFPLAWTFKDLGKAQAHAGAFLYRTGELDVADTADIADLPHPSRNDGADRYAHAADVSAQAVSTQTLQHAGFTPLTGIPLDAWRALAERAIEPNAYYLPAWELAVNASAHGRTGALALSAWGDTSPVRDEGARLIGLLPIVSMWRAFNIPLPALASASPYGTLCTPLLDRGDAEEAASRLMKQARAAGAHALILRDVSLNGLAMKAFAEVLRRNGLQPIVLHSHLRACLDARREADEVLHDALSAKKLKELRRQRNRLAEQGAVRFDVARSVTEVGQAVEVFLALEASGWKATRGTALQQNKGDLNFIRNATRGLAETGQCEIVTMHAGETPVAAAIVLRHQDRAFYFKLGIDEAFSKFSPGVQLTLDLTRHLCADTVLATADSTASAHHPMINPIWRGRLRIGDVVIPLCANDPVVSVIHGALKMRHMARELARRAIHFIRAWK